MSLLDVLQADAKAEGIDLDKKPKTDAEKQTGLLAALAADSAKTPEPTAPPPLGGNPTGVIARWSFSSRSKYEECPYILALKHNPEVPEPPQHPAAERGNNIHEASDAYIKRDADKWVVDAKVKRDVFQPDMDALRSMHVDGKVTTEEPWYMDTNWAPVDEKEGSWATMIIDALVRESETSIRIIDFKTGRKFGNEVKHGDQGLTYALAAFHRYPEVESFTIEFWYFDEGVKTVRTLRRDQLVVLLSRQHQRAMKMTTDTELRPTPSAKSCKYCNYGCNTNAKGTPYGIGVCDYDHYREAV